MREDELSGLLRSPALSLEPPPDLVSSTRAGARRMLQRRRAGAAVLSAVAVAGVALVVPGLLGGGDRPPDTVATDLRDPRFPAATTAVVVLTELNGGEVVTFFEGRTWCTAAIRIGLSKACSRGLGSDVPPFAFLRAPGNETLTVDRDTLVAGILGTGVERVRVRLSDGRELTANDVQADGFPRPVWWMQVPPGTSVESYVAYDGTERVVAERAAGSS